VIGKWKTHVSGTVSCPADAPVTADQGGSGPTTGTTGEDTEDDCVRPLPKRGRSKVHGDYLATRDAAIVYANPWLDDRAQTEAGLEFNNLHVRRAPPCNQEAFENLK